MQDQVPHPYTRMAKIIVLFVLIFHFTCMEDKKDSGFCDVLLNGLYRITDVSEEPGASTG